MSTSGQRIDRPLLGIGLTLVFAALSSHLDVVSKWFAQSYPVLELVWIRFSAQTIAFLVLMPWLGWRRVTGTRAAKLQIARGTALWLSATLFIAGLSFLPFATTMVLGQTAPLIVAAIALPLLGEKVGLKRWATILLGFAGLVIVVRPDFRSFDWAMLFPLGTACSYALYQVMTRYVAGVDSSLPSLFYTALVGWLLASLFVPFVWVTPTLPHLAILFAHGIGIGLGHFILIRAFSYAPASLVAPLGYTSLIWAVILGWFVFNESPDAGTLAGGTLIAVSGIALARNATSEPRR